MKYLICLFLLISNVSLAKEPYRIAVIDTGLDIHDPKYSSYICPTGSKDFTGKGLQDDFGHGSFVVNTIMSQVTKTDEFCLVILKYFENESVSNELNEARYMKALKEAIKQHSLYVNYSGTGSWPNLEEKKLINDNQDIIFFVAAGNSGKNIDNIRYCTYPACFKLPNVYVIGSKHNGIISKFSNYGNTVTIWEDGERVYGPWLGEHKYISGTSTSVAIHTGKVLHETFNSSN